MIFYFYDIYFCFILMFSFFIFFLNKIFYVYIVEKKINYNFEITSLKQFLLFYKIAFFFIIFSLFYVILFSEGDFLNFVVVSKIYIYIFSFLFIFLLEYYAKILKWFNFEYIFITFLCLFILSMFLQANNFINFYLLLETYSFSICSVILLKKINKKLVEAGFKYLLINIVSSCFLLLGISYIYFVTGLLDFNALSQIFLFYNKLDYKFLLDLGFFLIYLAFLIKLAIFPFSAILVEIYYNIPYVFSFFLLTLPKFIFVVFLINFTSTIAFFVDNTYLYLFLVLALITSFFHSFISVYQNNIYNFIINASFSNALFYFLPIICKSNFVTSIYLNFIFVYILNLFIFFCLVFYFFNNIFLKSFFSFLSIFYNNFYLTSILVVNLLSLASLPPFAGFFIKFFFFYILIELKFYLFYITISFLNLLLVFVYLRLLRLFFLKKNYLNNLTIIINKSFLLYFIFIITFFNIFFLFYFDFLYKFIFIILNSAIF